ncbi:MAG: hypothetical protein AABZ14_05385 [Candidatus Margulisiibacteriota bacterium]
MGGFSLTEAINNIATAQNLKFEDILGVATVMAGGGSMHGIDALADMDASIDGKKISKMIEDAGGEFGELRGLLDAIAAGKNVNVTYNKTTNTLGYSVFGADGKTVVAKAAVNLDSMEDFDVQGLDELVGEGATLTIGDGSDTTTKIPKGLTWTAAVSGNVVTLEATDPLTGNVYSLKTSQSATDPKYVGGATYINKDSEIISDTQKDILFTAADQSKAKDMTSTLTSAIGTSGTVQLTQTEIEGLDVGLTNADGIMQNPGTLYLISTTLQQMNQGISGQGATGTTASNVLKEAAQTYQRGLNQ